MRLYVGVRLYPNIGMCAFMRVTTVHVREKIVSTERTPYMYVRGALEIWIFITSYFLENAL